MFYSRSAGVYVADKARSFVYPSVCPYYPQFASFFKQIDGFQQFVCLRWAV